MLLFGDREVIYGDLNSAIRAGKDFIPKAKVALIPGPTTSRPCSS